MSLFDRQTSGAVDNLHAQSIATEHFAAIALMGDALKQSEKPPASGAVDPHRDARAIVRLLQCSQCSLPLRNPLTLPCGNSLCRTCLPETHIRTDVTYTVAPSRKECFECPFGCEKPHSLDDCSQDVTLAKVMDRVSIEVARCRPLAPDTPTLLDERPRWKNIVDSSKVERFPSSRILNGGRLVATYTFAELGELKYDSEVAYQTMSPIGDNYKHLDVAVLEHLKEATKNELDCQLCYALMLDPLTTPCGHTFCRKCVARVLDHSTLCPVCRRKIQMPPDVRDVPSNQRLSKLLLGLCPELVAARAELAAQEEVETLGEMNVPLFICTLGYPSMPTFLHIFEPRYRLMIRRAMESGDRKFGMLMYNMRGLPQGDLGPTQFMLYGTLLHIDDMRLLPDGRSLIETRGVSRFRVKDSRLLDGYIVGNVERVDDISIAEEEQIEANEINGPPAASNDFLGQINHTSTLDLLKICHDFIERMQAASAPWLHQTYLRAYGPPPDDAAIFPYWFASILPINDEEKYKLLPTTSVRERLKITVRWVRRIEAQRWAVPESSDSEHDDDDEMTTSDDQDVSMQSQPSSQEQVH